MDDQDTPIKYPMIVIVGLMDYGPHIWTFENAHEAALFMWGRSMSRYAIFKGGKIADTEDVGDIQELEKLLQ